MSFNEGVPYTTRWEEEKFSRAQHKDIKWSIEKRGFVSVLEHIRESKTPVVLHGAWLDLLLILKQFYIKAGYQQKSNRIYFSFNFLRSTITLIIGVSGNIQSFQVRSINTFPESIRHGCCNQIRANEAHVPS